MGCPTGQPACLAASAHVSSPIAEEDADAFVLVVVVVVVDDDVDAESGRPVAAADGSWRAIGPTRVQYVTSAATSVDP